MRAMGTLNIDSCWCGCILQLLIFVLRAKVELEVLGAAVGDAVHGPDVKLRK